MLLGYERIVNDKRILISVEESDDPVVTLKVQGGVDIRFRASGSSDQVNYDSMIELHDDVREIVEASRIAYIHTCKDRF